MLQAESNVATQEEQLLLAQNSVRAAQDALKSLLFHKDEEETWRDYLDWWEMEIIPLTELPEVARDENDEPHVDVEWSESLYTALERRSELIQQRLEIDTAELQLLSARSDRKPQLDLTLTAQSSGFSGDSSEALENAVGFDFPTYTAGVDFSMPIRNRTARFAERSARANVRLARLTYEKIEAGIVAEVRAAAREVAYQAEAVGAAETSSALAQRLLEAEQVAFRLGSSTTFQVLQFQQQLAQALSTETAARSAYAKALVALSKAEGRMGEDDG